MNKKGFSLVELIIVIAIMAILVGVMAPQLIKYIEKTNVSADVQLCDTIHSAIETALMDPVVLSDSSADNVYMINTLTYGSGMHGSLTVFSSRSNCECYKAVVETCGFDPFVASANGKCKSTPASSTGQLCFASGQQGSFVIFINHSDRSGKRTDYTANDDSLSNIDKVICVPEY